MVEKTRLDPFPMDILVDSTKSREAVFVDPDQSIYVNDHIASSFRQIDETYAADKEARIRFMAASVRHLRIPGTFGLPAGINAAYESDDQDAGSNELIVLTSPLNDGQPKSGADDMVRYINTPNPSAPQIARTRPNSWSPITKLDLAFQMNQAAGRPIPMLQIFSRVPPRAMTVAERAKLAQGDYSAYGRVALEGVNYVNRIRSQEGKTPVEVVHFFGAGIGQRTLAAARYMLMNQDEFEVGSAHVQNLSLHRGVIETAIDHLQQRKVNEPSRIVPPPGHVRIDEPLARQDIDHRGSDTLQMYGQQFWAIKDLLATTLPFMLAYKPTVKDAEILMGSGVTVRVTNGLNVAMGINTLRLLPVGDPMLRLSTIVGLKGQKVGMMANEHAGVMAITPSLGVHDYEERKRTQPDH